MTALDPPVDAADPVDDPLDLVVEALDRLELVEELVDVVAFFGAITLP